jgi:hypothetical protein
MGERRQPVGTDPEGATMDSNGNLVRVTINVEVWVDRSQVMDRQRLRSLVGDEVRGQVDEIWRSTMNS